MEQTLVDSVTCCVCHDVGVQPWWCCHESHVICDACLRSLRGRADVLAPYLCPVCRAQAPPVHLRVLEQLAATVGLQTPCLHAGCDAKVPCASLVQHMETCPRVPWPCPITIACPWRGPRNTLLAHIRTDHRMGVGGMQLLGQFTVAAAGVWLWVVTNDAGKRTVVIGKTSATVSVANFGIKTITLAHITFNAFDDNDDVATDPRLWRLDLQEWAVDRCLCHTFLESTPMSTLAEINTFKQGATMPRRAGLLCNTNVGVEYVIDTIDDEHAFWTRKRKRDTGDDEEGANKKARVINVV
jgi:hypothetical protein